MTGNGFSTVQYTLAERWNGRKWSVRPGRRNGVLVATSGDARMFADSLEQLRHLVATRSGGERRW